MRAGTQENDAKLTSQGVGNVLPFHRKRLISLADMIEFCVTGLAFNLEMLAAETDYAHGKAIENANCLPDEAERKKLKILIFTGLTFPGLLDYCLRLQMDDEANRLRNLRIRLEKADSTLNFTVIHHELNELKTNIWKKLYDRKFVFVPAESVEFFEGEEENKKRLFGQTVFDAFPSAREEIKEAGNCLAADLNTASLFHMMRVVEYGLRALARDVNVSISDDDLEYKQWAVIIDSIRAEVKTKTVCAGISEKDKSETREFYNGVLSEFEGFKDVWRNNLMHSRRHYNKNDSLAVFTHVNNFMQRLAKRISEGKVGKN